jgi:hypothetical protein
VPGARCRLSGVVLEQQLIVARSFRAELYSHLGVGYGLCPGGAIGSSPALQCRVERLREKPSRRDGGNASRLGSGRRIEVWTAYRRVRSGAGGGRLARGAPFPSVPTGRKPFLSRPGTKVPGYHR